MASKTRVDHDLLLVVGLCKLEEKDFLDSAISRAAFAPYTSRTDKLDLQKTNHIHWRGVK